MSQPVIVPPDAISAAAARARQDQLTKPPGSLGRLETLAIWLASCQRRTVPLALQPAIAIFAADHGVTAQGVSAYPSVVTAEMVRNFARGGAAISVLAHARRIPLSVIDVGVATDLEPLAGVTTARIRAGTADSSAAPAMAINEARAALQVGREIATQQIDAGANLLIGGEMGIGNTTAAAALLVALAQVPLDIAVGAGTGLDASGIERKRAVVARMLARAQRRETHRGSDAVPTDRAQPGTEHTTHSALDWLAQVGGLEIAALAGYYSAAAAARVPVIVDGFIATVAAIVAERLAPGTTAWLVAAHRSAERGHAAALEVLGLKPLLDLDLRLGEGSGAAVAIALLDAAVALHAQMATFDEAGVSRS